MINPHRTSIPSICRAVRYSSAQRAWLRSRGDHSGLIVCLRPHCPCWAGPNMLCGTPANGRMMVMACSLACSSTTSCPILNTCPSWDPSTQPCLQLSQEQDPSVQLMRQQSSWQHSASGQHHKIGHRGYAGSAWMRPYPSSISKTRSALMRTYSADDAGVQPVAEEPIIVAASWLGAKRGPFSKYKQLWQSLGYSRILAARPPMTSIMFPIQGQMLAANFVHKLLQKHRAHPTAPILVHLFSGGGFIFMGWVFQLLAELNSPEAQAVRNRIAGVILDSSPAMVNPDVSSRALVAAALGKPAEGIEALYPWLVKPTAAIVDGYLRLPFIRQALVGMDSAWLQQAPTCPLLFLYSDADVLIQPHVVEGFMQQQQARGAPTYSYKWKDSAHVDHYRKHPEEYKQQLQKFAQNALRSWAVKAGQQIEV